MDDDLWLSEHNFDGAKRPFKEFVKINAGCGA